MGYVRHTYDSPSPNEEHEVALDVADVQDLEPRLERDKSDAEALNVFLQL